MSNQICSANSTGTDALRIDGNRLWNSLMQMAAIGATEKGGCNRQALTDLDRQGRDLFVRWCEEAGCEINIDQMGNIFARRPGTNPGAPAVITGSHLDTQPTGGKFDGVYGVLAGLEVIRTLNDQKINCEHAIEAVCWTNEEGARFSPAMIGSGVWAGEFELDYGHSRTDSNGVSIKSALDSINYLGEMHATPRDIKAAFELHIEQGPILEEEGKQIGIVRGVQGMNWYDLSLTGEPRHAGPSPMESRKDPFMALSKILDRLYKLAKQHAPWSRVTFGNIKAYPGAYNTVPEVLTLAIDLRHPDQKILDRMDAAMRTIVAEESEKAGLPFDIHEEWKSSAVEFDDQCITVVRSATESLGYSSKEMFSGAGHDSVYVSRVAPTSMIFVPCKDGISHNEAEFATPEDITAGCNVLLHSILLAAS